MHHAAQWGVAEIITYLLVDEADVDPDGQANFKDGSAATFQSISHDRRRILPCNWSLGNLLGLEV
jgi:hypothetical protein